MAKKSYIGNAKSSIKKVLKIYKGDNNGIARKAVKGYLGDENGLARLVFGGDCKLTFTFTSGNGGSKIWASITLPDGMTIHHGNQIESVKVSEGDILRIFTVTEKYASDAGVYVNSVQVMSTDKKGTYYDYKVTKDAVIHTSISQPGYGIYDPETGKYTHVSDGYMRGIVKITEYGDF